MTTKYCFAIVAALLLASCGTGEPDIRQELGALTKGISPRVEPLPSLREPETFKFEAFDLPDPFQPKGSAPKKK